MESIPFWLKEILGGAVQALDRGHGNANGHLRQLHRRTRSLVRNRGSATIREAGNYGAG
jgi:hypothetical protein